MSALLSASMTDDLAPPPPGDLPITAAETLGGQQWSLTGALLGLVFAVGLLMVWHRSPVRRRTGLEERVGPYLWDVAGVDFGAFTMGGVGVPGWAPHSMGVRAKAVRSRSWAERLIRSRRVRHREERIMRELPIVADLLALSLGAGEGVGQSLERVCRTCRGELSTELGIAVAQIRTGTPSGRALQAVADRSDLPALVRFVDSIVIAVERGTPMADVVQAQAQDMREAERRRVIEAARRRQIAMLIPAVFLILPVTVVFALFPGTVTLSLSW